MCFPEDTLVSGNFEASVRALYSGPVTKVVTKSGRTLVVTPAHPLATPDGFVRAGDIEVGGYVLCYPNFLPGGFTSLVDKQLNAGPIGQVHEAIRSMGMGKLVQPAPDDLHGDAGEVEGGIEVATLSDRVHIEAGCSPGEDPRCISQTARSPDDCSACVNVRNSGFMLRLKKAWEATRSQLPFGMISVTNRSYKLVSLGPSSGFDAVTPLKGPASSLDSTAIIDQLLCRGSQVIEPEEVMVVERDHHMGHVYDLQALNGWMVAEGIIASN